MKTIFNEPYVIKPINIIFYIVLFAQFSLLLFGFFDKKTVADMFAGGFRMEELHVLIYFILCSIVIFLLLMSSIKCKIIVFIIALLSIIIALRNLIVYFDYYYNNSLLEFENGEYVPFDKKYTDVILIFNVIQIIILGINRNMKKLSKK